MNEAEKIARLSALTDVILNMAAALDALAKCPNLESLTDSQLADLSKGGVLLQHMAECERQRRAGMRNQHGQEGHA